MGGKREHPPQGVVRRDRRIWPTHWQRGQKGVWIPLASAAIVPTHPRKNAAVDADRKQKMDTLDAVDGVSS
jgi:hypothetical protein